MRVHVPTCDDRICSQRDNMEPMLKKCWRGSSPNTNQVRGRNTRGGPSNGREDSHLVPQPVLHLYSDGHRLDSVLYQLPTTKSIIPPIKSSWCFQRLEFPKHLIPNAIHQVDLREEGRPRFLRRPK